VTARCLLVCSGLLLFANVVYGAGAYQRAKDGKTLVWNNYPRPGDEATWSGKRDADGYATGPGTLTWFTANPTTVTGSNIPSKRLSVLLGRYSGNMVRGKFDGIVVKVDPRGKAFRVVFADGSIATYPSARPTAPLEQRRDQHADQRPSIQAPAEGPSPPSEQKRNKPAAPGVVVEAPRDTASPEPITPAPSPPMAMAAVSPRPSPPSSPPGAEFDQAVKDRIIADLKEQTESVLFIVGNATSDFPEIERLDSVQELPATVSKSIGSLADRTRDVRSKLGSEEALSDYRTESQTVDALSVVDQITRDIATNDASEANSKLADFLKSNPEPIADSQKGLWRYLTSIRSLCDRLEKEADIHLQRAQSFAAANRTSEAIREYQEAYRIFPNPATAGKIRQLEDNSLGL
jgi:hypothetical protein